MAARSGERRGRRAHRPWGAISRDVRGRRGTFTVPGGREIELLYRNRRYIISAESFNRICADATLNKTKALDGIQILCKLEDRGVKHIQDARNPASGVYRIDQAIRQLVTLANEGTLNRR